MAVALAAGLLALSVPRGAPASPRSDPPRMLWLSGLRNGHHRPVASQPLAVVHATPALGDASVLDLVVVFHGWSSCASTVMGYRRPPCRRGGGNLEVARRLDQTGLPILGIVPQLVFERRDGDPGRFAQPGTFTRFLEEVLARSAPLVGQRTLADVHGLVLAAHSAGYATLAAVLRAGVPESLRAVVLLDALYGHEDVFADYAEQPNGHLYVIAGRTTLDETQRLSVMVRAPVREARTPNRVDIDARPLLVHTTLGHEDVARVWLGPIARAVFSR